MNLYAYADGNPINKVDPDGLWPTPDTAWDGFNIGIGVTSLGANIYVGNAAGAAEDALGIAIDVTAAAIPGVPGGAGTALKVRRAGQAVDKTIDAITFGKNSTKKLKSHWLDIRRLAKQQGIEMPRKFKDAGNEAEYFIKQIVKKGETKAGPYKPTGGGAVDALWTRHGDSIVIRRPDGEFLTILDAAGGGAAKNFPGGL